MADDPPPPRPAWLLAASGARPAVLVEDASADHLTLPRLADISVLEERPAVAQAVEARLGRRWPVTRCLPVGGSWDERASGLLVIVEPGAAGEEDGRWVSADDPRLGSLGLEADGQAHADRWLDEVRTGRVDRRRQRWERPGFEARATAWMAERLAEAGTPVVGEPSVETAWAISAMLRAGTTDGRAWLKSCAWVFDAEPAITAAIHDALPGAVPAVVAIEPDEGWLLMRDAGDTVVGDGTPVSWADGLGALATVQRTFGPSLDGVELEDRSPAALAAFLPELADGPWVAAFPDDLAGAFRAALPRLVDASERLAALPPGPTLVHGDFHPWNVLRDGGRPVVIDWSDTAIGHPFVDLATYLGRTSSSAERRTLLDACLDAWAGVAPRADLEAAALLALPVGALHQVESYRRIVESLEPGATWGLEAGGPSWARRALAWLDGGLEAEV